jgi:hypothetical protein
MASVSRRWLAAICARPKRAGVKLSSSAIARRYSSSARFGSFFSQ